MRFVLAAALVMELMGCKSPRELPPAKPAPIREGRACVYALSDGGYEFAKPPCEYDNDPVEDESMPYNPSIPIPPKSITHGPKSPAVTGSGNTVVYQ